MYPDSHGGLLAYLDRRRMIFIAIADSLKKARKAIPPKQLYTRVQKRLHPLIVQDEELRGLLLDGNSKGYFEWSSKLAWKVKILKYGRSQLYSTHK